MQARIYTSPWRKLLLAVHVAATVSVLGTDLVLLLLGIVSLGGGDPRMIYPFAHLVSQWLVAPLAVLALGSGMLMGALTPWGLFRYWWVVIKLTITVGLTGVVLLVLVPRLGMAAAAVSGPAPRLLSSGERLPLVIAPAVASTLLLLNIGLAIFKPGGRVRARAATRAGGAETNVVKPRT